MIASLFLIPKHSTYQNHKKQYTFFLSDDVFPLFGSDFWEINKFSNFPWLPTHQTKLVLSNWIMFKQPKISGQIFPQILTEVSRFTTSCTVTKEQLKQTARWEFFPKVPDTIHSIFPQETELGLMFFRAFVNWRCYLESYTQK